MCSPHLCSAMLATVACTLLATATAQAQSTIAQPGGASKVSTYAGVTAYSVRGPDRRWRLVHDTNTDGQAEQVPIAARAVPFDVDLGPGTDGRVLAVYSRCEQEPQLERRSTGPAPAWTTARRCDLYRYDFRSGQEVLLDGPSTSNTEVLPTIWRDRVGFVRIYHDRDGLRGRVPYVYVREPGRRSQRQPGGGRGVSGLPGPVGLDLEDTLLGMAWTYEREQGGVSEMRLGTPTADGREVTKIDGQGWRDSVARYLTPTVSEQVVFAGLQRAVAQGDGSRSLVSRMYRYSFSSGNLARADIPAQAFAAVRDRRSDLTVVGVTARFFDARDCGGTCAIRRIDRPSFDFVKTVRPPARSCGDVGYVPNTDAGAFRIRAAGVGCATARELARDAEGRSLPFELRGFACRGRHVDALLPYTRITCTRGDSEVTFRRS
ncbi:MAG: hypothetical protein ACLGI5_00100 [Thermoleophilia bacterium]